MKIGIITDIHYGPLRIFKGQNRGNGSDALEKLPIIFEHMKKNGVEAIINLGDNLAEEGKDKDLAKLHDISSVFRDSGIDVYHILGNHECTTLTKEESMGCLSMKSPYYFIGTKVCRLFFLDAQDNTCSGLISDEQKKWFQEELPRCDSAYVFVHQSLAEPEPKDNPWFCNGYSGTMVKNRKEIRNIIENSGKVRLVMNGHLHEIRRQDINGIIYQTLGSWSEFMPNGKRYESYAILEINQRNHSLMRFGNSALTHSDNPIYTFPK